jgi:LysM repeat protein
MFSKEEEHMRYTQPSLIIVVALVVLLAITLLPGCGQPVQAGGLADSNGYVGVLSTAYADALDVTSQLALGTLRLKGAPGAVTEAQSVELLPLWQALAGSGVQDRVERNAVLMQIEATMTTEQLASIAALQLTGEDLRSWMDGSRSKATASDAQGAEEIAVTQAQLGAGGSGRGMSCVLTGAVVELLAERSGGTLAEPDSSETEPVAGGPAEPAVAAKPTASNASAAEAEPVVQVEPTIAVEPATASDLRSTTVPIPVSETSESTLAEEATYVVQAGDTLAAIAHAYGVTVEAIVAANGIPDADVIAVGQELVIPDPAQVPAVTGTTPVALATDGAEGTVQKLPGLEQIQDTNPGPLLAIEIGANYAIQDPVVEKSQTYVVTGIVRNDGDETYAVSDILVTFYDAEGFRGTFSPAIRDGKLVGGEWHWHGETEAVFAALLLAPGEEWPFRVAITAQDMASFLIHVDAAPTDRESAEVELSDIRLVDGGTGYVQIAGTATNRNPFEVKNVTVSGVLTDASGEIVSLGSTYVLQQGIEPGASVRFDVRIEKTSYVSYRLFTQAERDW